MAEERDTGNVKCELWPGLASATQPVEGLETPEPPAPGMSKHVRIDGVEEIVFWCFTDAHPGEDHVFRVGDRRVTVPRDKFQLQDRKLFLQHEVTWD